jgi:hypothetical protein
VNRAISAITCALALAACGDNTGGGAAPGANTETGPQTATLVYTNPAGGKLRLIKDPASVDGLTVILDFVVGDDPVTGYATGFDLPLAAQPTVVITSFAPGIALAPGTPAAARAVIPTSGPLAHNLVTAQSQKVAGPGAVTTDAVLAPGTMLYQLTLTVAPDGHAGVVFDGTAPGYLLASGGLRDKLGTTVVSNREVGIGKLEIVVR